MSVPVIARMFARATAALLVAAAAPSAGAQSVPTIDTEDATLGLASTSSGGRLHPSIGLDARNGDFARANYDDDRADLDRLPIHVQAGLALELTHRDGGEAASWLVLRSSNGFHAPGAGEAISPRGWYESNNLAALVFTPAKGLRTAIIYTIKTSPNGVSATTHEASLSLAYDGDDALGGLSPTFAVTARPKGAGGLFTQAGIEPSVELATQESGPKLSLPLAIGTGWGGFYGAHTGSRAFASAGAAVEQSFSLAGTKWSARAEALALVRDDRLAALSGPQGETHTVVPLVTLSISMAY